jgi:hypothetical protein
MHESIWRDLILTPPRIRSDTGILDKWHMKKEFAPDACLTIKKGFAPDACLNIFLATLSWMKENGWDKEKNIT